jgi:hypothetical protein
MALKIHINKTCVPSREILTPFSLHTKCSESLIALGWLQIAANVPLYLKCSLADKRNFGGKFMV